MAASNFIGFRSDSGKAKFVMYGVSISIFCQYGLLWMIATFDIRKGPFSEVVFGTGIFPDFNADWFRVVGWIVIENMAILSIMPLVDFFGAFLMRLVKRIRD